MVMDHRLPVQYSRWPDDLRRPVLPEQQQRFASSGLPLHASTGAQARINQSPTLSTLSLSLYLERSTTGFFGPHNFHFQILPASGRAQHSVCLSVCLRRRREIWTASLSSANRRLCVCGGVQHLEPGYRLL